MNNRTKRNIAVMVSLILFAFSACSSLPGRKETRTVDTKNRAAEYMKDGIGHFNGGRYDRAMDFFTLAYQLNASVDHEEGIAAALNSIGRTKLMEGKYDEALEAIDRALLIAGRVENSPVLLKAKSNLADYYVKIDDLDKAHVLLAEELVEMGDPDSEEKALLAHNMSLVLRKMGRYDEALLYLEGSLRYNQKGEAFRALAADYYMKASILSLMGDYEDAFSNASEALFYDKMTEYPQGIAADLEALAIISGKMGHSDQAEIYRDRHQAVIDAIRKINQIGNVREESEETPEQ